MKLVITAMPMVGHLTPMLAIARIALARGDDVIVLTASHHADKVRGVGARFVPLPPSADMDLSRLEERFPERAALPLGPPRILFDFQRIFLDVMPAQAAVLREILDEERPDILVTDAFFFGATPIFLDRTRPRPPIVACGTTFLPLDRPDGAPTGPGLPPARDEADRARYVTIAQDVETHLNGPVRAYADALLAGLGLPALPCSLWQSRVMLAEAYLQPTAPSFEYDFGAPPNDIRFVGVLEACAAGTQQPDWWGDLDGTRRIVLVTQGTVANDDFSQLVEPTLAALRIARTSWWSSPPVEGRPPPCAGRYQEMPASRPSSTCPPCCRRRTCWSRTGAMAPYPRPCRPACRSWRAGQPRTSRRSAPASRGRAWA